MTKPEVGVERNEDRDVEVDAASTDATSTTDGTGASTPLTSAGDDRGGRVRRWGVGALVVLSCLLLLTATVGLWAKNQVFDTDNFERIVVPLGAEPEIQRELATYLTDQLSSAVRPEELIADALPDRASALAPLLAGAVEDYVRGRVADVIQSDRFQDLWRELTRRAHERAILVIEDRAPNVSAGDQQVTLNLVPVINEVIAVINESTPDVFGRTITVPEIDPSQPPSEAIRRLSDALGVTLPEDFGQVTVYDDGKLAQVQQGVRSIQRIVVILVVLAVLLPVAAVLLSRRRRRTALQYALGAAITMVFLRRLVYVLERMVLDRVVSADRRRVVANTLDRLMHNLLLGTAWLLVIALVAALVLAVTGPYPWARRVRTRGAAAGRSGWRAVGSMGSSAEPGSLEGEITGWVGAHRSGLQIAGAVVAALVLLLADLTWVGLVVVLVVVALWEVLVTRWGSTGDDVPGGDPPADGSSVASAS